ncbi:UNVERIFIED_CONTAM: hypothetical protein FKN15_003138 [Acipenser sinensis]
MQALAANTSRAPRYEAVLRNYARRGSGSSPVRLLNRKATARGKQITWVSIAIVLLTCLPATRTIAITDADVMEDLNPANSPRKNHLGYGNHILEAIK